MHKMLRSRTHNRFKLDQIAVNFHHNSHHKRPSDQNQTRQIAKTYSNFTKVLTTNSINKPFDAEVLHVKKQMHKRVIRLLFLPIAAFLWIIGWTMLWAGSYKRQQQTHQNPAKTTSEGELITIMGVTPKEPEECEA
jgi:hypothetical protein